MGRGPEKLLMKLHGTGAGETLQGERQVYHHPTKIPMPSASSAIPQDPTPHPGLASPTPDVPAPANSNDFRRKYCQLPRPTLKIYMNKLPLRSPTGASQRKTSGHAPPLLLPLTTSDLKRVQYTTTLSEEDHRRASL